MFYFSRRNPDDKLKTMTFQINMISIWETAGEIYLPTFFYHHKVYEFFVIRKLILKFIWNLLNRITSKSIDDYSSDDLSAVHKKVTSDS